MITPNQMAAALRYVEMAIDAKKMAKAREAFKLAHKADLIEALHEAERAVLSARQS